MSNSENFSGSVVILANGEFPHSKKNLELLRSAERVVCCDGAAARLSVFGRDPDDIVGDLDSLAPEWQHRYSDRIVRVTEQETNDLAKAFRLCIQKYSGASIVILGATGRREDHLLGNISLLADFTQLHSDVCLETDFGTFRAILESGSFASRPGQQISIFSFDPEATITSDGLKYPLQKTKLKRWWNATLNEALSATFSLEFTGTHPLLIFWADELKE